MSDCVIVVWHLVPYLDARFSLTARQVDFTVIEVVGQDDGLVWSDDVSRAFAHISLAKGDSAGNREKTWARLESELDRLSPKIVVIQGWSVPPAIRTARWALKNNARIVIISESNSYDHPRSAGMEWGKARVLGVCDAAFVGGRDNSAYLVELGFDEDRIALGYDVVDNDHFAPPAQAEASAGQSDDAPYFLIVSRLVEGKNVERVLKAYSSYRQRAKARPWDLVILGVGPLENHLRKVAGELALDEHVRFDGFRKYHELPAIYHGAGALVHASAEEPWGLVVNEAMASGLPVIVSKRCGCWRELVSHGVNGFALEPEDVDAITRYMIEMSDGSVDRVSFGRNSRRIIAEWGLTRFACGFRESVEIAQRSTSRKTILDRFVFGCLARWR